MTGRRAEAAVVLEAIPSSILSFEDFIGSLAFLSPRERSRLKVAGGEILDNIVKHATPVDSGRIRARASRRGDSILLGFYFRSPSFAAFAAGLVGGAESASAEPLFDPARRRWRGIGLLMCRNLASRVVFRPGESMDRIFLEFEGGK
jgi:anti-sigma regulatory factor (Ser/Thr protein kinase)